MAKTYVFFLSVPSAQTVWKFLAISTHINCGVSYLVNDFYKRFIDNNASEKRQVLVGRISTVGLMILAAIFALGMIH